MRIVFVTSETAGSIVPEHIARILVGIPSGRIGGIRGPLVFQQAGELIQIITRRVPLGVGQDLPPHVASLLCNLASQLVTRLLFTPKSE